jgi:hypothetical protein
MPTETGENPSGGNGRRGSPGFFGKLNRFWQRVSEGLELQVLWAQFSAEARSSYSLYVREVDWEALAGEKRVRRFLRIARALFWAMLMKLSPARRVFLLIALLLGLFALIQGNTMRTGHGVVVTGPDNGLWVLLSIGALLFLLRQPQRGPGGHSILATRLLRRCGNPLAVPGGERP